MNRKHAVPIALILAVAAILGAVGLFRTTHAGATGGATSPTSALVAMESARLDQAQAQLRRMIARAARPAAPAAASSAAAPRAQKIVYVRPAPHVITIHRPHSGDDGSEGQGGGRDD